MTASAPAPDLPPGPRLALVVATSRYADASLARLRSPTRDAEDLAAVLADPDIGGFAVTSLTDRAAREIRLGIEDFLSGRGTDDLLLLYLSCHGVRDTRGRLYFAATDTHKSRLASTGVESAWLLDRLDECRARRQVLILDCCFSGAFAHGAKGGTELELHRHLVGHGRGRAVLTASRAGEYSFEGTPLPGATGAAGSVFTTGLVEGLRTGAADADHDGYVSVEDAYDYAYTHVQNHGAAQTPQRWLYGAEGRIWVARSPAGRAVTPTPVPESLRVALDSPYPGVRLGAVHTLGEWLAGDDPGLVLTARRELERIAADDIPRVAGPARELLPDRPVPAPDPPPPAAQRPAPPPVSTSDGSEPSPPAAPRPAAPRPAARWPAQPSPASRSDRPDQPSSMDPAMPSLGSASDAPQLLDTLTGHTRGVVAIAFSPDGRLVTADADRTVRTWSLRTGRCTPYGGMPGVLGVAFNPGEQVLVVTGGPPVVLRRLGYSRVTHTLTGHTGEVLAVAVGPDTRPASPTAMGNFAAPAMPAGPAPGTAAASRRGKADRGARPVAAGADRTVRLATASADRTVRLWDPVTGRHLHTLSGHPAEVLAVGFGADRRLAGGGADGTVLLWDPVTGHRQHVLTGHSGAVRALAFSGDGRRLATASDDGTVRLWDPVIWRFSLTDQVRGVRVMAFSWDGRLLATAGTGETVHLWDSTTGRHRHALTGHSGPVRALAFSRDDRLLASGGDDGTVRLWTLRPADAIAASLFERG